MMSLNKMAMVSAMIQWKAFALFSYATSYATMQFDGFLEIPNSGLRLINTALWKPWALCIQ